MPNTNLPKWLIAEDVSCLRQFIIHTESPRFVGEIFDDDEGIGNIIGFPKGEIIWIDDPPMDASALAKIMRQAGDALMEYDDRNEAEYEKAKELDRLMDEEDPF